MTAPDIKKQHHEHHQHPCTDSKPCDRPAEYHSIASDRNHYFTGKLMTARDFRDESNYFLSHSHAHNRLLHGWGIVCGLNLEQREGKPRCLYILPGIALDCCGHELIVREEIPVELPEDDSSNLGGNFLICLCYCETGVEFMPALYAEGCAPGHREPNRIREGVGIVSKPFIELENCWKTPSGKVEETPDCDEPPLPRGCLQPHCVCDGLVPVVRVTYEENQWKLDTNGRTMLPNPAVLTKIKAINWTHGTTTDIQDLSWPLDPDEEQHPNASNYALVIQFSRKVLPGSDQKDDTGVNPFTFTISTNEGPLRRPYDPKDKPGYQKRLVKLLKDGCTAIYRFTNGELMGEETPVLKRSLYITLKCDFILDENHIAVDGNYLGGQVPTGDGVPGGQFESWLRITDKHDVLQQQSAE